MSGSRQLSPDSNTEHEMEDLDDTQFTSRLAQIAREQSAYANVKRDVNHKCSELHRTQTALEVAQDLQRAATEGKAKLEEVIKAAAESKTLQEDNQKAAADFKIKLDEHERVATEVKALLEEKEQAAAEVKIKLEETERIAAEGQILLEQKERLAAEVNGLQADRDAQVGNYLGSGDVMPFDRGHGGNSRQFLEGVNTL
jgi:hypothetical protein